MILPDKIIDAHVHLDIKKYGSVDKAVKALISEMRRSSIEKVVLLALEELGLSSENVARIARDYEEIIPIMSVHPYTENATDRLEELLNICNFKGLKLHPRLQCFSLNDERVFNLIKKAAKHNLPVIIDAFPYYPGYYPEISPENFNKLALSIPEAKIVIAHLCGHKVIDTLFVAKINKNIYLDLSFSFLYFRGSSIFQDILFLIKNLNGEKILYGSDYPSFPLQYALNNVLSELNRLKSHSDFINSIFYENIKEVFLV
jgi:predicted TIM-barrel fold metal-dependent hydrolase